VAAARHGASRRAHEGGRRCRARRDPRRLTSRSPTIRRFRRT
jgi:hypothetical protein